LFFAGRDVVSVYSLATNAWEIIDVLCIKTGIDSLSVQTRLNVPEGKDLKRNYINSPYRNFFKHADNDGDQTLSPLPDSQVEGVLFLAVEDYIRLNGRSPVQLQVFQLWYLAKYPEKLDAAIAGELMEEVASAFPGLPSLSRDAQLALGAQVLAHAAEDEELANDLRTERAFA
jgi:hypothetical protein